MKLEQELPEISLGQKLHAYIAQAEKAATVQHVTALLPRARDLITAYKPEIKTPYVYKPNGSVKHPISKYFHDVLTLEIQGKVHGTESALREESADPFTGFNERAWHFIGKGHLIDGTQNAEEMIVDKLAATPEEAASVINHLSLAYLEIEPLLAYLSRPDEKDTETVAYYDYRKFDYEKALAYCGPEYALDREVAAWFSHHVGSGHNRIAFQQHKDSGYAKVTRLGLTAIHDQTGTEGRSCPAGISHMTNFFNQQAHFAIVYAPLIRRIDALTAPEELLNL